MQLNAITGKSAIMAILLLVTIVVAAVVRYSVAPFEMEISNGGSSSGTVSIIVAVFLFLFCGFIEGKMLLRSGLSNSYCTLPMPIYGVLACGVFIAPDMVATAAASCCFAIALHLLLRSLHNAEEKDSVFFASILLGATALLYPPCVVLVAVIPIAIFTLALTLRQSILMFVGYSLPLFAASYVVWYGGVEYAYFWQEFYESLLLAQMTTVAHIPYVAIALVAFVAVILLGGAVYTMARPNKIFMLTRVRRSLYLFLFVMFVSLMMVFVPACDLSAFAIIAVPTTVLLSFVFGVLPNNISTIGYWILLVVFFIHLFLA